MNYTATDHTFMICAYQENPYLEDCILSVMNQTVLGNVKLSTSTPNEYIIGLAKKYGLPLVVNHGKGNQVSNLNFAYSQADTPLVTLCHQDDYYHPAYLENILCAVNRGKTPIIIYTDYYEDREGKKVEKSLLLNVKRTLNFPLRFSVFQSSKWVRRRILSFGNPICCPSVTFHKKVFSDNPFSDKYSSSLDWEAWIRMSVLDGEFIYCTNKLVAHRIWGGSDTSRGISNNLRSREDYEMFCRFWPAPIAKLLARMYSTAEKSNTID